MDSIVDIIILLISLEIISTIGFIILIYLIKIYRWATRDDAEKLRQDVEKIFLFRIEDRTLLSKNDLKEIKKDITITLSLAEYFDHKSNDLSYWKFIRKQISEEAFLPIMRKSYNSKAILTRYFAARLFLYHYEESDALKVIHLINDTALYISVTASKVGFKFSSILLINAAIDFFYKSRRLQRSVLSSIAAESSDRSRTIVVERLFREEDPYVRAFCYSIMMQFKNDEKISEKMTRYVKTISNHLLPPFHIVQHLSEAIPRDLNSKNLDLRIAALHYAGHNPAYNEYVKPYLCAPEWQLRAAAAKIMGNIKDESSADKLGELLRDPEWWVRIRAAQSLVKLGPKGIQILKSQSIEQDKYAYEAANQALLDIHEAKND